MNDHEIQFSFLEEIVQYVKDGDTKPALERFYNIISELVSMNLWEFDFPRIHNDLILLLAKFNRAESNCLKGLISRQEFEKNLTEINQYILTIIRRLEQKKSKLLHSINHDQLKLKFNESQNNNDKCSKIVHLKIQISGDLTQLKPSDISDIVYLLQNKLDIKYKLLLTNIEEGSVILTFEILENDALRLIEIFNESPDLFSTKRKCNWIEYAKLTEKSIDQNVKKNVSSFKKLLDKDLVYTYEFEIVFSLNNEKHLMNIEISRYQSIEEIIYSEYMNFFKNIRLEISEFNASKHIVTEYGINDFYLKGIFKSKILKFHKVFQFINMDERKIRFSYSIVRIDSEK